MNQPNKLLMSDKWHLLSEDEIKKLAPEKLASYLKWLQENKQKLYKRHRVRMQKQFKNSEKKEHENIGEIKKILLNI